MSGLVDGKVALITGAGHGIGRAAAALFAREGARVVLADTDMRSAEAATAEIIKSGGEAAPFCADVSRPDDVAAMVAFCVERFGRLDCAHNNAGITGSTAPVASLDAADWSRVLEVNLTGTFLCLQAELGVMVPQGSGAIVNTSSGSGIVATPGLAHYCASKHGLLGLTKTVAIENARTGVRINAVCPGSTDTPQLQAAIAASPELAGQVLAGQPGGRLGTPGEIAEAVVWLCSDRASFVTGAALGVDGGAVAR